MTKEQLLEYEKLADILLRRCKEIWDLMTPINESFQYLSRIIEITDDEVCGMGDEYWRYGGHEEHYASFPKSFIYKSDESIKKYVENELRKKEEEERKIKEERESRKREEERKLYEELKTKYEKGSN